MCMAPILSFVALMINLYLIDTYLQWKTLCQSLRRKIIEAQERMEAAELAVEDERREVLGKAKALVMEADAKRETEVRVLKQQKEVSDILQ